MTVTELYAIILAWKAGHTDEQKQKKQEKKIKENISQKYICESRSAASHFAYSDDGGEGINIPRR